MSASNMLRRLCGNLRAARFRRIFPNETYCGRFQKRVLHDDARTISEKNREVEAGKIMDLAPNRAFKYIFLRMLPLRRHLELADQDSCVKVGQEIENIARQVVAKYVHFVNDDRAKIHLYAAALAVAGHRVLGAHIRDEGRVFQMLREAFGAGADTEADSRLPGHWIGKAGLFFTTDRMKGVRKMTRNAAADFGSNFKVQFHDDEQSHQMTVSKCLYAEVCGSEGLRSLTRIFCALDRAMFSHVSPTAHGIEFNMGKSTLADGDDKICEFQFVRR